MAARNCEVCQTRMPPYIPRRRDTEGRQVCWACHATDRGGYVSAEPKLASLAFPTPAEGGEYEGGSLGEHLRDRHGSTQDELKDAMFRPHVTDNLRAGRPTDAGIPTHDVAGIGAFIQAQYERHHQHLHATENTNHEHPDLKFTKPIEDTRYKEDARPFKYGDPNRAYGETMGDGGGVHAPWRDPSPIGRPKPINPDYREPSDPTPNRVMQGHPNEQMNGTDCDRTYPEAERNYPEKGSDDDPFHWHDQKMPYEEQERRRQGGWEDKYICPNCHAYKALHTGTEWNDQFNDRMHSLPSNATSPFKPLPQSLNTIREPVRGVHCSGCATPLANEEFRFSYQQPDGSSKTYCPRCEHTAVHPNDRDYKYPAWARDKNSRLPDSREWLGTADALPQSLNSLAAVYGDEPDFEYEDALKSLHDEIAKTDPHIDAHTFMDAVDHHADEAADRMRLRQSEGMSWGDYLREFADTHRRDSPDLHQRIHQDADEADAKPGVQPGEDLPYNYGNTVGWVRARHLKPYLAHEGTQHGMSQQEVGHFQDEFKNHGWKDSLMFMYHHGTHSGILGEGNHRLNAQLRNDPEGYVPVRVVRAYDSEAHDGKLRPLPAGTQKTPQQHYNEYHQPDMQHPGEVFPDEWMHPGNQTTSALGPESEHIEPEHSCPTCGEPWEIDRVGMGTVQCGNCGTAFAEWGHHPFDKEFGGLVHHQREQDRKAQDDLASKVLPQTKTRDYSNFMAQDAMSEIYGDERQDHGPKGTFMSGLPTSKEFQQHRRERVVGDHGEFDTPEPPVGPKLNHRKTAEWSYSPHPEPIVHVMGQRPPRPLQTGDTLMHPDSGYSAKIVAHTPNLLLLEGRRTPVWRSGMEGDLSKAVFGETAEDRDDMEKKLDVGTPEEKRYLEGNEGGPSKLSFRDQESCPHDGGWNLHGQCKQCGYLPPTEADEPCDDPWCVEHEPEHSKGEHIDPPHLDPGHPDYHSAEQNINDAIGDDPDGWMLDHQPDGPSKFSKLAHGDHSNFLDGHRHSHIELSPEDMNAYQEFANAGKAYADALSQSQKTPADLSHPHELRQHMQTAHEEGGWVHEAPDDEVREEHDDQHREYAEDWPHAVYMDSHHFHEARRLTSAREPEELRTMTPGEIYGEHFREQPHDNTSLSHQTIRHMNEHHDPELARTIEPWYRKQMGMENDPLHQEDYDMMHQMMHRPDCPRPANHDHDDDEDVEYQPDYGRLHSLNSLTASIYGITSTQMELFDVPHDDHLPNPAEGGHDWHHGTPKEVEHLHHEPDYDEEDPYADESHYDREHNRHWNSYLGDHWTSLRPVADKFAKGEYHHTNDADNTSSGEIFSANLRIKNPKIYNRETKMDSEAVRHVWPNVDYHDPSDVHREHCDDDQCYDLEGHDHEADNHKVEHAVRDHYARPAHAAYWMGTHPDKENAAWYFKQHLQKQGHDGVVYGNEVEGPSQHPCAITFDKSQVQNVRRSAPQHSNWNDYFSSDAYKHHSGYGWLFNMTDRLEQQQKKHAAHDGVHLHACPECGDRWNHTMVGTGKPCPFGPVETCHECEERLHNNSENELITPEQNHHSERWEGPDYSHEDPFSPRRATLKTAGHAQVFVMGGDPPEYPHAFMPVCRHPDHGEEWSGTVYRGNDTDSPGWHQAWDDANAHDREHHTSPDSMSSPDYDREDPFTPRTASWLGQPCQDCGGPKPDQLDGAYTPVCEPCWKNESYHHARDMAARGHWNNPGDVGWASPSLRDTISQGIRDGMAEPHDPHGYGEYVPEHDAWSGPNYGEDDPFSPRRQASKNLPQHVRAEDIPKEGISSTLHGTQPGEWAPAWDDHPHHHFAVPADKTYSLHYEPLTQIMPGFPNSGCPGGRHGAHCYAPEHYERQTGHDIAEPEEDGSWSDDQYVRKMIPAAQEDRLPAFTQGAGGGHRLAALYDAGKSHYYIWRPDNGKHEWLGDQD